MCLLCDVMWVAPKAALDRARFAVWPRWERGTGFVLKELKTNLCIIYRGLSSNMVQMTPHSNSYAFCVDNRYLYFRFIFVFFSATFSCFPSLLFVQLYRFCPSGQESLLGLVSNLWAGCGFVWCGGFLFVFLFFKLTATLHGEIGAHLIGLKASFSLGQMSPCVLAGHPPQLYRYFI